MQQWLKTRFVKSLWQSVPNILERDQPKIIAVTGSVGKTTTKEAIVHLLSQTQATLSKSKMAVRGSVGNMNTELTIPLVIGGQTKVPRTLWQWFLAWLKLKVAGSTKLPVGGYLVLEFASEKAGDIAFLAERVPLDAVVFTQFTLSHAGESLEAITKEKLTILIGLKAEGVIITNADDGRQERIQGLRQKQQKTVSYGAAKSAQVQFSQVKTTITGTAFQVRYQKLKQQQFATQLIGQHQAQAVTAAIALNVALGGRLADLVKPVASFTAPAGRMRLIAGRKEITIIDDTYNSSPAAAFEALKTLGQIATPGQRKVAILGNMNALGRNTVTAHLELGRQVAECKIDYLVAVGPNATRLARGAREGGLVDQNIITFSTPESLISRLDSLVRSHDLVLVKASQDQMRLERVVRALMAEPAKARQLLVRQDY